MTNSMHARMQAQQILLYNPFIFNPLSSNQTAELGTFRRDLGCRNTFKLNSGAQNGCSGAQFQTPKSFRCGLGAGRRSRANAQRQSVNIYSRFSSEYFHLNKKSNIRNWLASSAGNSVCLSTGACVVQRVHNRFFGMRELGYFSNGKRDIKKI